MAPRVAPLELPTRAKSWPAPRMLTLEEVAQACGVHVNTVRKWVAAGVLVVVRLPGRCVRVSHDAWAAFRSTCSGHTPTKGHDKPRSRK